MAFFKHKEETDKSSLPELPGLSDMPELPALPPSNKSTVQPLPTFPRTTLGESQGLGAIKNIVEENKEYDYEIRKTNPIEKRTIELSEMTATQTPRKSFLSEASISQKEPVFVKLDKFQDAIKKFSDIKIKVNEIEDALNKIREIKDKEEQELKSWEQEVQMIKDKVEVIDSSLFNKI